MKKDNAVFLLLLRIIRICRKGKDLVLRNSSVLGQNTVWLLNGRQRMEDLPIRKPITSLKAWAISALQVFITDQLKLLL